MLGKRKLSFSISLLSLLLVIITMLILLFTSCSEGSEKPTVEEKYSFIYNNVQITPGNDIAPILNSLGESTKYYEAASCAFNGLDKMYTYGSLQVNTYPDGGCDRVLSIVLLDDSIMTPEGITIGTEKDKVIAVYGTDFEVGETALIYKKGGTELRFILRDGYVTSIQYYDIEAVNN